MLPIDIRNATWDDIKSRLTGLRARVLEAWRRYGVGTTRDTAARCGIDILSFRPRTTELYQLGAVELVGPSTGSGGEYRARSEAEWSVWLEEQRKDEAAGQQELL